MGDIASLTRHAACLSGLKAVTQSSANHNPKARPVGEDAGCRSRTET